MGEIHQISGWNPLDFKGEIPHPAFIKLQSFCWNTCFYNLGGFHSVISGWNLPDFMGEIHQITGWNLVDFMKSLVIAPTLHSSNWRVFAETLSFIIFGFHRWYLGEICQISWISWNLLDFMVKSAGFQGEICMKSTRFHEIRMKSVWNLPDFMKSIWNPPDFMNVSFWVMIKYRSFYRKTKNTTWQRSPWLQKDLEAIYWSYSMDTMA